MTALEQKIVRDLFEFLTARGWAPIHPAIKTHADVLRAIERMGVYRLAFERGDVRASVLLIEGNGEDVVSDWSAPTDADLAAFSRDADAFLDDDPQRAPESVKRMILILGASGWTRLDDGFALGPIVRDLDMVKRVVADVFATATWDGATVTVRGDEAREFFTLYRKAAGTQPTDPATPWLP